MSGRERPEKRKAAIAQDEVRADGIKVALEELKKRYKTLHTTTCEYAQEIIELKKCVNIMFLTVMIYIKSQLFDRSHGSFVVAQFAHDIARLHHVQHATDGPPARLQPS